MYSWQGEIAQLDHPYHSTVALETFLKKHDCFRDGTEVLDVGCGLGAPLVYFRRENAGVRFLGVDHNSKKLASARKLIRERGVDGIEFETAGFGSLDARYVGRFDGVLSIHAVCCLKRVEDGLAPLIALAPRWIAVKSLFWDGDLDVLIHPRPHYPPAMADDDPNGDFNIFSLTRTADYLARHGYQTASEPFFPPKPIPRRTDGHAGTYTIRSEWHAHTQFSGPVFLPWHFVLGQKTD